MRRKSDCDNVAEDQRRGDRDYPTSPQKSPQPVESTKCHGCGMPTSSLREYHPFTACALFEQTRNSRSVLANLKAVVEYGMEAQRRGLTASEAMEDLTKVYES